MKQLKVKNLFNGLDDIVIGIFIILLVMHSLSFWSKIHNVDLAWNARTMVDSVNAAGVNSNVSFYIDFNKLIDVGADYRGYDLTTYYIDGMKGLERYFLYATIDCLIIGYCIGLKFKHENKTEKENGTRTRKETK